MRSHVKYIGVIDKNNKNHYVEFTTGVNVITGKSSTGKSAMIEIFDYCMGSREFNIPSGIITDNADIYFLVLSVKDVFLIIGRRENSKKIFLKEEAVLPEIESIDKKYFEDKYFTSDFNVSLGHYFGLDINDIDEDKETKKYTGKKKGRPSIRNMIPFLLQHQNLIANKHSLFYRFDEKEKREQTIDQFKIFTGFVTQEYYILKQNLSNSEKKLKKLENQQKSIYEQIEYNEKKLKGLLQEYKSISGNNLFEESEKIILSNPAIYINKIRNIELKINDDMEESSKELIEIQEKLNQLYAQKRKLVYKYKNIEVSVKYTQEYKESFPSLENDMEVKIKASECPFCHQESQKIIDESNKLEKAIDWLNNELQKSPYILDSFESDKNSLKIEIDNLDILISEYKNRISKIKKVTKELQNNRSLENQSLKIKLKIENLLESLIDNEVVNIENDIKTVKKEIKSYKKQLVEKFDISKKLKKAEAYINNEMRKIGQQFDFEESYKPVNLHFSLDTFELWHQKENGDKIYLRSMGSGANWLYSHMTLFLAIHKFFCSLGNKALVPPILFLDQPTQVYFPTSIKDNEIEFNAKKIEEKKGGGNIDEDMRAVTNIFNKLVEFCQTTLKETGIEPQIIVTDHADNLELNSIDFKDLVNGRRWRTRGFIYDI